MEKALLPSDREGSNLAQVYTCKKGGHQAFLLDIIVMMVRATRTPSRIWNEVKPGIRDGDSSSGVGVGDGSGEGVGEGSGEGVGDGPGDAVGVGSGDVVDSGSGGLVGVGSGVGSGVGDGAGLLFSVITV